MPQIIEIYLEPGEGEKGAKLLRELEVPDFNLLESPTNDLITVRHPLNKTDRIISRFEEEFKFRPEDRRGIIISSPDVILPKEEEKERRFYEKSAWESMIEYGEQNSYLSSRYLALFLFAAVVATLGLITDNVAVVVGAMIIAPAFGPLASVAIGIVAGRMDLFWDGIKNEIIGIGLAIGVAAFLGFIIPGVEMNESLRTRMYPTIYDLLVALAAGAAGGYVLVSGKSTSVVGVMVAAALIPVMAAIGIGVVFLNWWLVFGAFLLLLVNAASIGLAMVVVFWFVGPQPETVEYERGPEKFDVKRMITGMRQTYNLRLRQLTVSKMVRYTIVLILVLAIPLMWLTYEDLVTKAPEKEISEVFKKNEFAHLELGAVSIEGNDIFVTVYNLNSPEESQIRTLFSLIKSRIDPRYHVEFNIVQAQKFDY